MTFIWDDLYWHVVKEDENYDKNRFAIVRTLFIQLNAKYYYYSKALKNFNRVNIRKEFEVFGNIESVILLNNGKSEAYVTFVDNKSAAMAYGLMNCSNDLKITEREYLCFKKYDVHIANTWHQPPERNVRTTIVVDSSEEKSSSPAIFGLNEDCLRHIFTFCNIESLINLSQTSKTFNNLLSAECGSTTFRQFTTLRLIIDVTEKDRFGKLMTLGKGRKFLRCVGPYMKKLVIKKLDEANVQRYFEKIVQYAGDDLYEMEIYDILLTENLISILQPIFIRLKVLKIQLFSNNYEIDLKTLCPNLMKLKVAGIVNIERSCKHWPNLQHVSLLSDIILPESFCLFISLNPHLKSLKFFYQHFQQIQTVASSLPSLEKLEIDCKYKSFSSFQLSQLSELSHLKQLTLLNLKGRVTVVEIFLTLTKFKELRSLKLHISEDENHEPLDSRLDVDELKQQTIAALAHKLINLEKLLLFNINLDEATLCDIVRSANQLKVFHIHNLGGNVQWSSSLIHGILNIRKLQQQKHLLKLYLDKNLNSHLTKEDHEYLRIYFNNFGCHHAKIKCYKK